MRIPRRGRVSAAAVAVVVVLATSACQQKPDDGAAAPPAPEPEVSAPVTDEPAEPAPTTEPPVEETPAEEAPPVEPPADEPPTHEEPAQEEPAQPVVDEPGAPAEAAGECRVTGDGSGLAPLGARANDELTQGFRDFGNSGGGLDDEGGWAASDGVYSATTPGGDVVWLMNDTFLGPVEDDESLARFGFLHGTILPAGPDGLPSTTVTGGVPGAPESIASPPEDDGSWYWNADGIVDGGKLRVFQSRTGSAGEGHWGFEWLGMDLVTYTDDFRVESVDDTYGSPQGVGISWGSELVACEGHVYVYGSKAANGYVARAQEGHLVEQTWEFWDGTRWTTDEASAAPVAGDVGASFGVAPVNGGFVLVTSSAAIFDDDRVYVATAASPTGPFEHRQAVYTAPEDTSGDLYGPYNVAVHPAVSAPGELVASYNVNSTNGDDILANANDNRPRFVTIDFGQG